MRHILKVTEQKPTKGGSIYCECSISSKDGFSHLFYGGNMYFVCNKDRVVTQYFSWLKEYKYQLNKLGYKL